jgi:hypothetical protein
MERIRSHWGADWPRLAGLLAVSLLLAACAGVLPPRGADESDLLATGFKPLVAATPAQEEWVRTLAPGKIRPMQRNDKKFFVYPDAAKNQILVGGPEQYEAYLRKHPDMEPAAPDAATAAYRMKQDDAMKRATARDLSDPFLGASWGDFGW